MARPYVITGLEGTGTHPRLEIRDLQRNPIQFSLFIRGYNKIHDMKATNDINNPVSFWQIGGIHGRPYIPWSGDPTGPQAPVEGTDWEGYCFHTAALFPTWHRAQMLLVEQAVVREAIEFASRLPNGLPTKPQWVRAAHELRFPFWDWTKPVTATEGIPEILRTPIIGIASPDGPNEQVPNPFDHYKFPDGHLPGDSGMGLWERTWRWAEFTTTPPTQRYDLERAMWGSGDQNRSVEALRTKIAGLFKYPTPPRLGDLAYGPNMWGHFASSGSEGIYLPPIQDEPLLSTSPEQKVHTALLQLAPPIEEPHGSVHANIGGGRANDQGRPAGTMSDADYAGYEPIFYLHHCMVDRIYAFWEYIYHEYWIGNKGWKNENGEFVPFLAPDGTWDLKADGEIKGETALPPFRIRDSAYWTSDNVRSLLPNAETPKYYTYPPIVYQNGDVKVTVNVDQPYHTEEEREKFRQALYNEWATDLATDVKNVQEVFKQRSWDSKLRSILLQEPEGGQAFHLRNVVLIGQVPEFAFPGSYRLEVYILPEGGPALDSITVFGRSSDKCGNCRRRQAAGSRIRGHMYLPPLLLANIINSYAPEDGHLPDQWSDPLDWLVSVVQEKFGLRIVESNGTRLADTHASAGTGPLEESKIPKVTFHSHLIRCSSDVVSKKREYIPVALQEAREHGTLDFGGQWQTV